MRPLHLSCLLIALAAPVADAQSLSDQPAGRIVEQLTSPTDSAQRYAVYLPSAYRPDTTWPVLFLMDPRGRALEPLRRFQPAAERLGYVAISSYNTLSDGPAEPNFLAFNAMLKDVQQSLSVDGARLYLAGFSGTARLAWVMASHLRGHVAGLVAVGAGLPAPISWLDTAFTDHRVGVFLTAGTGDFNYEEVRHLAALLEERAFPQRLQTFEGPHAWPPEEVCTAALEWLSLAAMRKGLAGPDRGWADSLAGARLAAARREESAGRLYEAYRAYESVAADFENLADIARARERAAALSRDKAVRERAKRLDEAGKRERKYSEVVAEYVRLARQPGKTPDPDRARSKLRLEALKREAEGTKDSVAARAAGRMLENVFVQANFYLPAELFRARRFDDAAAVLAVAQEIRPGSGSTCLGLARAYAQLGRTKEAMSQLACAAGDGAIERTDLAGDPLLQPLAGEPQFRELVSGPGSAP